MAFHQVPVGERGEVALGVSGEDRIPDIEQVDAAVESAGAGFCSAIGALGDDAEEAMRPAKEQQDLGCLAVGHIAEADTAVLNEGHRSYYRRRRGEDSRQKTADS